jgi:hypothetical protein
MKRKATLEFSEGGECSQQADYYFIIPRLAKTGGARQHNPLFV